MLDFVSMPSARPSFMRLLEEYREASGRTWKEVERAAGVEGPTRGQWANGVTRNPPLVGVVRLAAELDVPPDALFRAVLEDSGEVIYSEGIAQRAHIETRLRDLEVRLDDAPTREEFRELRDLLQRLVDEQDDPPTSG